MPLMADNWTGPDKNSNYTFDRTSLANNTSAFKCQKSKIWTKNAWYQNCSDSDFKIRKVQTKAVMAAKFEQTLKKHFLDGREKLIPPFSNNLRACEIFIDKIYESFAIHLYLVLWSVEKLEPWIFIYYIVLIKITITDSPTKSPNLPK